MVCVVLAINIPHIGRDRVVVAVVIGLSQQNMILERVALKWVESVVKTIIVIVAILL